MDNNEKLAVTILYEFIKEYDTIDTSNIEFTSLSEEEIKTVATLIDELSFKDKIIFYDKFIFKNSYEDTEAVFDIKYPRGKYLFRLRWLSGKIGLKDQWIDDNSMEKAVEIVHNKEFEEIEGIEETPDISWIPSQKFIEDMKKLGIDVEPKKNKSRNILKRVAMFFLILSLSFSIIMGTNAKAREVFVGWVVENFEKYSSFKSENKTNEKVELTDFEIGYIPERFKLNEKIVNNKKIIYSYSAENGEWLDIIISSSKNTTLLMDTEDVEIEELVLENGTLAYFWKKNNISNLISNIEDISLTISGNINKKEIFEIQKNIKRIL